MHLGRIYTKAPLNGFSGLGTRPEQTIGTDKLS